MVEGCRSVRGAQYAEYELESSCLGHRNIGLIYRKTSLSNKYVPGTWMDARGSEMIKRSVLYRGLQRTHGIGG